MTYFLPRLIGAKKAFELAFVKKILTAQEAIDWGIVNDVVPDEKLIPEVTKIAKQLVDSSGLAIGSTKRLFQISQSQTLESQMENETAFISLAGGREDLHAGVTAFIERRKPFF